MPKPATALSSNALTALSLMWKLATKRSFHSINRLSVIRVSVGGDVCIEFEDGGKPYNPLGNDDPDTTAGAKERKIGGLGIFMVKKIMDAVEYRREGNKNILTIKKGLARL